MIYSQDAFLIVTHEQHSSHRTIELLMSSKSSPGAQTNGKGGGGDDGEEEGDLVRKHLDLAILAVRISAFRTCR